MTGKMFRHTYDIAVLKSPGVSYGQIRHAHRIIPERTAVHESSRHTHVHNRTKHHVDPKQTALTREF